MQDSRIDTSNERDENTRSDEMREDRQAAPATTADIAAVDDDKMIDRTEAVDEPESADEPEFAVEAVTEHTRAEAAQAPPTREPDTTPLFDDAETGELRDRWTDVQSAFVDEPKTAVEQADALVADVMKRLATGFADERKSLEGQWSRGDDVSTEDLRVAMQRYRSFFDRLLSV